MVRYLILLIGCALLPLSVFGEGDALIKQINFNLGSHTEFYNALQNDASGGLRKFDFAPTIGVGARIPLHEKWNMFPEFNWVLPQFEEDSHIIINTFMYRFDFGYDVLDWLRLRAGTGIMHMNQHGRGGKSTQNNGTGQSTFYYPEENHSSLNNTLDLGVEILYQNFAFRVQTYTYSVFKKERRQLSGTFFLTYYWDR